MCTYARHAPVEEKVAMWVLRPTVRGRPIYGNTGVTPSVLRRIAMTQSRCRQQRLLKRTTSFIVTAMSVGHGGWRRRAGKKHEFTRHRKPPTDENSPVDLLSNVAGTIEQKLAAFNS